MPKGLIALKRQLPQTELSYKWSSGILTVSIPYYRVHAAWKNTDQTDPKRTSPTMPTKAMLTNNTALFRSAQFAIGKMIVSIVASQGKLHARRYQAAKQP